MPKQQKQEPRPKKVQLAVRISQDVHRAAKAHASIEGISLADFVEHVLFRALLKDWPKHLKIRRPNVKYGMRGFPVLEVKPRKK